MLLWNYKKIIKIWPPKIITKLLAYCREGILLSRQKWHWVEKQINKQTTGFLKDSGYPQQVAEQMCSKRVLTEGLKDYSAYPTKSQKKDLYSLDINTVEEVCSKLKMKLWKKNSIYNSIHKNKILWDKATKRSVKLEPWNYKTFLKLKMT